MNTSGFLIINNRGGFRATRSMVALEADEVAVKVNISIPDAAYDKPRFEASIIVDPKAVAPAQITPEVLVNTKELIERSTGMRIELKALPVADKKTVGP